jgi:hypothetical protein
VPGHKADVADNALFLLDFSCNLFIEVCLRVGTKTSSSKIGYSVSRANMPAYWHLKTNFRIE